MSVFNDSFEKSACQCYVNSYNIYRYKFLSMIDIYINFYINSYQPFPCQTFRQFFRKIK